MKRKFGEWFSVQLAKKPGRIVIATIFLFNILFVLLSAVIIRGLRLSGTESMGFLEAMFCTVTMILDAGCISFVIADIGQAGAIIVIVCLFIIIAGMIMFTGAVIGYITNYISSFIETANSRTKKIKLSNHIVILNWNTRASEIINDLLYCKTKKTVIVLSNINKSDIEKEIEERLSDTVARENAALRKRCSKMSFSKKNPTYLQNKFKRNVTVIVKEGNVFSSKQLHDISLEYAKTVIILENNINDEICKYGNKEWIEGNSHGNSQTVKTLMQVADITASEESSNDQKIIVEITDDWTWEIVAKIIKCKQVDQKCNIVPVRVNKILGQILAQFALMPELNLAYKELFSNKGATFYSEPHAVEDDEKFVREYLNNHRHSIPLTCMKLKGSPHAYYSAASEKYIHREEPVSSSDYKVSYNKNYWIEKKNVIILGHNSKCHDLMEGLSAFRYEWNYKNNKNNTGANSNDDILRIIVIDDEENLKKMNNYSDYPFVIETVCAGIYDKDIICSAIKKFVDAGSDDISVLILSDDAALNEAIDSKTLAGLVYVQDIINDKKAANPNFDTESIDVIVEIIDPKHHDIVSSYSVNNVVISNRYISKMITQIGEKEALFDFYTDIFTYDMKFSGGYNSKEIYVKKVSRIFSEIPKPCSAAEFIRAVYAATADSSLPEESRNPAIVLGYVKPGGKMVLFEGDQANIRVELEENDKLILFSRH